MDILRTAVGQEVKLVCFGELSSSPYFAVTPEVQEGWMAIAEDAETGPTVSAIREFEGVAEYFGDTYFVGPDAYRLEDISTDSRLFIADVDLAQMEKDPSGWNLKGNRRIELDS